MTTIGNCIFCNCTGISNVTNIGEYAFYGCTGVSGVTGIGDETCDGAGLTEITIPSSVTSVGEHTFASCTNLKAVYTNPATPPICGAECFYGIASDHVIWVSEDSYNDYISSDWNIYNIQALDDKSAIDGLETADGATATECYDLQGRRLNAPVKGVNIIKYFDGTVRKIYYKGNDN